MVALSLLELFVAFLQAYIFMFLTALFMGMALHPAALTRRMRLTPLTAWSDEELSAGIRAASYLGVAEFHEDAATGWPGGRRVPVLPALPGVRRRTDADVRTSCPAAASAPAWAWA